MSHTPLRAPAQPAARRDDVREAVDGLLRDLGASLQRGSRTLATSSGGPETGRLVTGLPDLDALTGGFAPGRLAEIAGPASSGRTSVAHALVARATRRGETVAWVDAAGSFDPASARDAGAVLGRVLWVRPPALREALRCCACLLDARGFALVLLDLADRSDRAGVGAAGRAPAAATWQRLARSAAATGTPLLVLSPERTTGHFADPVLELQPARAHFGSHDGSDADAERAPLLLEGLQVRARVARHRAGPIHRVASLHLSAGEVA